MIDWLSRMAYRRSIKFWALLIVGWLIAAMVFSVLTRVFASFDDMTSAELWITGITIHALAVLAGVCFARSKMRSENPPAFPVVVKSVGERDAG